MRTHRSNRGRLHTRRACWSFRKHIRSPISLPACAAIAACSLSATDVSCLNRILMRRLYNMCTRTSGQHTNGRFASPTTMFENFSQTLRYHFREKEKKNVDRACYFQTVSYGGRRFQPYRRPTTTQTQQYINRALSCVRQCVCIRYTSSAIE